MKNEDPFEQLLRRQPLRPIPAAWREEILGVAAANQREVKAERRTEDRAALLAGWRLLFPRLPIAWAALAALWLVLVGVNLTLPSAVVSVVPQTPSPAQMELLATLDYPNAAFEPQAARFIPAPKAAPASEPATAPRRPRSERLRDNDTGETHPFRRLDSIA